MSKFDQMTKSVFAKYRILVGLGIGLVALVLYSTTMAPDIGAHDVSEWQAVGITLGIAHGPGSPAYTLISHLFSLVPIGLPAARVTFLSVVMGVVGVLALYVFVLLLFNRVLPALVSASALAVSGMWWAHASVATPYNAMVVFMVFLLILLFLWSKSGNARLLWLAALLAGAGLAYHPLLMFFLPIPIVGMFLLGPWRKLLKLKTALFLATAFLLGLSIYLYLPIRSASDPSFSYTKIDSVSSFIKHVSASQAREKKLDESAWLAPDEIGDRLNEVVYQSYYPFYIFLTFLPMLLVAYPGVWRRLKSSVKWIGFLAGGMVVQTFLIFVFSDIYAHYYLPLLFYFALWSGFSIYVVVVFIEIFIEEGWSRQAACIIFGVMFLGIMALGIPRAWEFANHQDDRHMREYVDHVLRVAKPNAVIIASWETSTGIRYVQTVEGKRTDITVITADPERRDLWAVTEVSYPSSQILSSVTFNIRKKSDINTYGGPYPLSHKALTWQDFKHGMPYPWSAQLFEIRGDQVKPL